MREKHYRLMKNILTDNLEKKMFCLVMDLPESNSSKKTESKMKSNLPEDYYSFQQKYFYVVIKRIQNFWIKYKN